jgi:hypothetical protein
MKHDLEVTTAIDPTWRSIHTLAEFAMRASGADGYALYEIDHAGKLILRDSTGLPVADPTDWKVTPGLVFRDGITVSSYPLRGEDAVCGLFAFRFRGQVADQETLAILDRLTLVIEAVYHVPRSTVRLAARISSLDAELASIKISERTAGLLTNGGPASESVETVVHHVKNVLQGCLLATALERLLPDLEDRVAERKLVVQAKQVLQHKHGISEEQAYLQLRHRSRASRRRLREVAQEALAGCCVYEGSHAPVHFSRSGFCPDLCVPRRACTRPNCREEPGLRAI